VAPHHSPFAAGLWAAGLHAGQQAGQYLPSILTGIWSVSARAPQVSQLPWCQVDCKQSLPLDGVHAGWCELRDISQPSQQDCAVPSSLSWPS
jgi:hypothetical protein